MLINNYLSFQSPHRSLKGFVNLVYFKNVKFRALQSPVCSWQKYIFSWEDVSTRPGSTERRWNVFLLSTFLLLYCSIFMKFSYSWCFWLFLHLGVKKFLTILLVIYISNAFHIWISEHVVCPLQLIPMSVSQSDKKQKS